MRKVRLFFGFSIILFLITSIAAANDFDWMKDLNIRAQTDPSGFRARLSARFRLGNVEINAVLADFEKPADAYMALRLGEMSGHPVGFVTERYKTSGGKGWGVIAKGLGIKPGSEEFHALKNGYDLYDDHGCREPKGREKSRSKDKSKKNK